MLVWSLLLRMEIVLLDCCVQENGPHPVPAAVHRREDSRISTAAGGSAPPLPIPEAPAPQRQRSGGRQ